MTISKYKEGELVWQRHSASLERSPAAAYHRMQERLERLGFFTECGYHIMKGYFWITIGTGDNELRFGI